MGTLLCLARGFGDPFVARTRMGWEREGSWERDERYRRL